MSNSAVKTLQEVEELEEEINQSEQNLHHAQEWETMARLWLSAFPEAKAVSTQEVESWIDSNYSSLPSDLQSISRSDIIDRLLSIQNHMRLPLQVNQPQVSRGDVQHARFQRTDQWLPVYSWLESLDKDEVVKSKDISDWLTENPEIREQLCAKHSRYHLMHYIKKCHMKILKRREKKKGIVSLEKPTAPKVQKPVEIKEQKVQIPNNPLRNIPKDSDLYAAKRHEAMQKYQILLELEKKLSPLVSQRLIADK